MRKGVGPFALLPPPLGRTDSERLTFPPDGAGRGPMAFINLVFGTDQLGNRGDTAMWRAAVSP